MLTVEKREEGRETLTFNMIAEFLEKIALQYLSVTFSDTF